MGEAVVEQEEVGRVGQAPQGRETRCVAVGADHDRDAGELPGEQHRLVSGDERPEERARAARDQAHPSPRLA